MKREPVYKSVTPQEMERMRQEGLTNKQIAERCGCSISTVYSYIGKRSFAVANAQAQNKPCPVPDFVASSYQETEVDQDMAQKPLPIKGTPEPTPTPEPQPTSLKTLREVRIIQLQGSECQYEVNTGDKTVMVKNGAVEVIMFDLESLSRFIDELNEISAAYIR